MNAADYLETKDGAKIYYEDHGKGRPIILLHGWTCSSRFWQKNVPELAGEFRVVTVDMRGHGNSSKILTGHTVDQYARDLREVIEHLNLRDVLLVGWSLTGSVVLSYYQQFAQDSRLKALGLVDTCPFPFSSANWNSHVLRDHAFDRLQATLAAEAANPSECAFNLTERMFRQTPSTADVAWIVAEMIKTPAWIAVAIYSDFAMSDYVRTLPDVKIPLIVCAGDSQVFPKGIAMGKALADLAPHGIFIPFTEGGHFLFYEQPQKFNAALAGFFRAL